MTLFAEETLSTVAQQDGILPSHFWPMILGLVIVFAVAMILYMVAWRVIDKITPGDLDGQIIGTPAKDGHPERAPNLALAIVVGAMLIGMSVILGCTILAVLMH
jgi:hypothetical protein